VHRDASLVALLLWLKCGWNTWIAVEELDIPHCRVSIPKFAHHPASLNVEEILPDGVLFSQHWEDLTWALSKPAWGDSGDLVWQRREKPAARS
jgi:hypothetical protein